MEIWDSAYKHIGNSFLFFHFSLPIQSLIAEKGLINRLEKIREYSKKALVSNDLKAALEGYKVAADIAEKFPHSLRDEKAILYSNMAAVHLKKDEPKKALEAVEKSLCNDAGYVKVNAQEKRSARAHFSWDLSLKLSMKQDIFLC